jgi:hypothetical protein
LSYQCQGQCLVNLKKEYCIDNLISTGLPAADSQGGDTSKSSDDDPHGLGDGVVVIMIIVFVALGIILFSCIGLYIFRCRRKRDRENNREAGIAPNGGTQNFALSGLSLVSVDPSIRSEQLPSYREAVAAGPPKANEDGIVDEGIR